MADASIVAYNIATFIATLFLLEFGADKFIDHTAVIARRTGLSKTIIGLVTAGGEWEEVRELSLTSHPSSREMTADLQTAGRDSCVSGARPLIPGRW